MRTVCIIFESPTQTLDRNLKVGIYSGSSPLELEMHGRPAPSVRVLTHQPTGNRKQARPRNGHNL